MEISRTARSLGHYARVGLAQRARRAGYTATGRGAMLRTGGGADHVVIAETPSGYRIGHGRRGTRDLVGPDARRVYPTQAEARAALPVVAYVHDVRTRHIEQVRADAARRVASTIEAVAPAAPPAVESGITGAQLSYLRTLLIRRARSGEKGGYEARIPTLPQAERMDRRTASYWITYLRGDVA